MLKAAAVVISACTLLSVRYCFLQQFSAQLYADVAIFLIIPLAIALALGFKPKEVGLRLGETRRSLPLTALLLLASSPLIFIASRFPIFYSYYPMFSWARGGILGLAAYELFIFALMLSTEFFFRGFLMFGTKKLGAWQSNLLQAVPYTIVHIAKPPLEIPASLVGGLLFGWLDQRYKSVLPSVILHCGFNLVMDIFCLQAAGLLFA